jgi:oligopeptide/dipeptide ABC transporter ATP-binding protein
MPPLLEVEELYTWFPIKRGIFSRTVGHVRAVDGLSVTLNRGETLGIVGESGCGKTTLARTVMRLDPARSGAVRFEGQNLLTVAETRLNTMRQELQIVFQDPFSSLNPRMTVRDIVTEGPLQHGLFPAAETDAQALKLLQDVGMGEDALHRYPHEFSGGQRQRISVARALSLRPKVIICDEAVSALDVSVQAQVINLLMDLRDKYGLSYLFISHDLSVVRHISDRVAVMYLGRIVETGAVEDVIGRPHHPYTRALISAIPHVGGPERRRIVLPGDVPSPANPPAGCRFHPRCPFAVEACAATDPTLEPLEIDGRARSVACLRKDRI